MSRSRLAAVAALLVLTTVIGGTLIQSVAAAAGPSPDPAASSAAPAASSAPQTTPSEACREFRAAFAAALGVDESALTPAAKTAAKQVVDAALAAGRMTQQRAEALKARIDQAAAEGCGLLARRTARVTAALGVIRDGVDAAADALDLTRAELVAKLRAGQTLQQVAADAGVPYDQVSAAVVAAVKRDLDAAVAKGAIPQARADRILERLQQNLAVGRFRAEKAAAPAGS